MHESTINKIEAFFRDNPIAKGVPATPQEIGNAENVLNIRFDADYVLFQLHCGGSMIGSNEIYGFHNSELMDDTDIIELTMSYREDYDGDMDWLIIGSDYSGNQIGINEHGNVVTHDHDFGGHCILAETFEQYILDVLRK